MENGMNGSATWNPDFSKIRTESYAMLSALLGEPPSDQLREMISNLLWDDALPRKLDRSLLALRRSSRCHSTEAMNEEFFKLFVGLGSGELMPYASWYMDKRIQSMPLVHLRTDLNRLGIVKQNNGFEPEDHVASICEVMTIISDGQSGCALEDQADFFRNHLATWMTDFFHDLGRAKSANFYRKVGDFGSQFIKYESQYLDYQDAGNTIKKGGHDNENRFFGQPTNFS